MKVVLFCGGLGTRLREHSETIPKPLVNIGYRPIIWHLMRYYAYFGHKDFILCLGYRGDLIKECFLNYRETLSNDFTLSEGGRKIELHGSDIADWRITFVETGLHSNLRERLMAVRAHVGDDEVFLANYSDGLSDVSLDAMIENFHAKRAIASFIAVRTWQSFHSVQLGKDDYVQSIGEVRASDFWINGGFFIFRKEIFDYLDSEEGEIVEGPFRKLAAEHRLIAFRHEGYWQAMDTFKDKIAFDRQYARGDAPWQVWRMRQAPTR
jgi:glucose-1-phosphate cytidylyltransferase